MSSPPRDISRSKRRRFLCSALLAALALLLALPEVAGQTPRKAVTTSPSALPLRVARPASGAYADPGDDPSSLARHKWKDHKWKDHHEAERDDDDDDDDDARAKDGTVNVNDMRCVRVRVQVFDVRRFLEVSSLSHKS